MGEEDLIPFNRMSKEQAKAIQSLGGSTVSPQKKIAAELRELRKKALTDETAAEILGIIENPEASALQIKRFIDSLTSKALSTSEQIKLGHLMIAWHKAHFGEKRMNHNTTVGVGYKDIQEMMFGARE